MQKYVSSHQLGLFSHATSKVDIEDISLASKTPNQFFKSPLREVISSPTFSFHHSRPCKNFTSVRFNLGKNVRRNKYRRTSRSRPTTPNKMNHLVFSPLRIFVFSFHRGFGVLTLLLSWSSSSFLSSSFQKKKTYSKLICSVVCFFCGDFFLASKRFFELFFIK